MNIKKSRDKLNITLPSVCTIVEVESDADKVRSRVKGVKKIEVRAGGVEEIDTAYHQLLLSMMATVDEQGIEFSITSMPDVMKDVFDLYGVNYK